MKTLTIIFSLILTTISFSQPLAGYKFCIDPGHGGNDPANDRYMAIADFWESEGNFYKALHLEEMLTELGAEVILTRYGNSNSDDIGLSARSAIANANNVDYFHSIHSNALNGNSSVNRTLMLFRGYTHSPIFPEAKEMSNIMVEHLFKANRTTGKQVSGDWSFYTWWEDPTVGLGVLRNLSMPGTLSEGSFHDYYPETFRLKNDSYLRHEAWALARSFIDLYDVDKIEGDIIIDVGGKDENYEGISKELIHATGKLILRDEIGIFGNPTADSKRTSLNETTINVLSIFFTPPEIDDLYLDETLKFLKNLYSEECPQMESSTNIIS